MPTGRKLAAIMFTDLAGYTRLTQSNEPAALRLLQVQDKLVRPVLEAHHGRKVKTIGDGILIEFPDALDAVECSVDLQRRMHDYNSREGTTPLRMRVGIHLGDVQRRKGDIFGDAVNIASRIEPLAEVGGVCLSAQVFDQVHNKVPYRLEKLGPKSLEGVRTPVDVYRVHLPWVTPDVPETPPFTDRIAVLPFANLSPDPRDAYFADGITEELIGKISGIGAARVIARTSVMHYKGSDKKLSEIAEELRVGTVVEGSVRRSENRLRLTVQLIDARTEEHLWAAQYDRELEDIFAIQSEIATKVAESIHNRINPESARRETANLEAYTSYLRGVQLVRTDTPESHREAVRQFEHAISQDPRFAHAYVGLAEAWTYLAMHGAETWPGVAEKTSSAARKAVELRPDLADAHAVMAEIHSNADRHQASIEEAEIAVRLNPSCARAYLFLGVGFGARHRLEQSLSALRKAHDLDPLTSRVALVLAEVAEALGRDDEALSLRQRMSALYPENPHVVLREAMHYAWRRQFSEARETLHRGMQATPASPVLLGGTARIEALLGHKDRTEKILRQLRGKLSEDQLLATQLDAYVALGDLDRAFSALDQMAERHSVPFLVGAAPPYRELWSDPRFTGLCGKVGIAR